MLTGVLSVVDPALNVLASASKLILDDFEVLLLGPAVEVMILPKYASLESTHESTPPTVFLTSKVAVMKHVASRLPPLTAVPLNKFEPRFRVPPAYIVGVTGSLIVRLIS
jgi:hypothetical protein